MTARAAGGQRTGCATLTRCEQQQHQQQYAVKPASELLYGVMGVFSGVRLEKRF